MHLDIITPNGHAWSGEAEAVQVPGTKGSFEMLRNHAPILSTLTPGQVRIRQEGGAVHCFRIDGGVIEAGGNRLTLLTETVQPL